LNQQLIDLNHFSDLNQETKIMIFQSSNEKQKNHVVLELCVMSVTHLINIVTGFRQCSTY